MIADLGSLRYVPARDQWPRRTNRPHIWIVLHSIEALELSTTAEGCAAYFANPGNRQASTQFVCDNDSTIRCMDWNTRGASAVGANDEGWHIEQAGYARQTIEEWHDAFSLRMIRTQVAPLVAALCARDGIPVRFVDANGLKRGEPGITTHHECWKAFGGDVRTDPGAQYPMDFLIELVRRSLHPTPNQPVEDDPMPFEIVKFKNDPKLWLHGYDRDGEFFWLVPGPGDLDPVLAGKLPTRILGAEDINLNDRFNKITGL